MDKFERIYRRHREAVFRFSMHCAGRADIAEDIASEVFLELHRHIERIDETQLPAWLFAVARNRAADYRRRTRTEHKFLQEATLTQARIEPSPEGAHPLAKSLLESKALKPTHRSCLILRYVHGMDRSEIARHTGFTEMQVKGLLRYALEILRREMIEA